ncbi:Uncharacterized protein YwbE [Madurella mycetomatis]|uniref:Uncharacterized protein YwbE n=1 Tax=Madurella mycetomatis TaxID=100816 RepID=A0A175VR21_9PEZI|nr:Uncharacterized protein YwbE [Madurella mycetomatis]
MARVPTITLVVPGAHVNIVMKADQPTGRMVRGTVAQVLTRGNHPRGIKVRLADGRVGRVQSMAGTSVLGTHDTGTEISTDALPASSAHSGPRQSHDRQLSHSGQEQPLSAQQIGLDAYIKPAKKRGRDRGRNGGSTAAEAETRNSSGPQNSSLGQLSPQDEASTCPVCHGFTGDAAALTHHVQSHFDD